MRSRLSLSPESPVSPLLWYAVLGSAIAWALQFGSGYWITEAQCSPTGGQWEIDVSAWTLAIGAVALAVAIGSAATAVALFVRTSGVDSKGPPPAGRIRFLAAVGMAVAPLFIAMIVMTTVGVLVLQPCNQS
jgi:cobalamin biosynthesis protein CobD/CbiB